jgi:hypothetical protein
MFIRFLVKSALENEVKKHRLHQSVIFTATLGLLLFPRLSFADVEGRAVQCRADGGQLWGPHLVCHRSGR